MAPAQKSAHLPLHRPRLVGHGLDQCQWCWLGSPLRVRTCSRQEGYPSSQPNVLELRAAWSALQSFTHLLKSVSFTEDGRHHSGLICEETGGAFGALLCSKKSSPSCPGLRKLWPIFQQSSSLESRMSKRTSCCALSWTTTSGHCMLRCSSGSCPWESIPK